MANDIEKELTLQDIHNHMVQSSKLMAQNFSDLKNDFKRFKDELDAEKRKVKVLEGKVQVLEDDKKEMRKDIDSLKEDVIKLKDNVNMREQYARSWALRITGLTVPREEQVRLGRERAVMKCAYDKVLKPILTAAKAKGDIETVPSAYYTLLENGHHINRRGRGAGGADGGAEGRANVPQIIVRFSSRFMRNVVLRNKKTATPKPTDAEVAVGIKRYGIFEDLTSKNYQLLKSAISDKRILKAWTIDGQLRFVTEEDPDTVRNLGAFQSVAEYFKPK